MANGVEYVCDISKRCSVYRLSNTENIVIDVKVILNLKGFILEKNWSHKPNARADVSKKTAIVYNNLLVLANLIKMKSDSAKQIITMTTIIFSIVFIINNTPFKNTL